MRIMTIENTVENFVMNLKGSGRSVKRTSSVWVDLEKRSRVSVIITRKIETVGRSIF